MIKSRYKLPLLVLMVGFSLFFIMMPFLMIKGSGQPDYYYIVFPLFTIAGLFFLYKYFTNSPRIVFDTEFITAKYLFNTKTYNWTSVREVFLSRKEDYLGQSLESTVIMFNDHDKLVLMEDIYSNLAQVRSFIFQNAPGKIRDVVPDTERKNLQTLNRRVYSGNVFFSMNNIMMLFIAAAFIAILWPLKFENNLFFEVPFFIMWYLVFGIQMNYFLIDGGELIIKNHYFPWKNKRISLTDIEEVDFETPYRRSNGLRIMSKDYSSKLYGAGTLRDSKWKELQNDLKFIGIPVRDDR